MAHGVCVGSSLVSCRRASRVILWKTDDLSTTRAELETLLTGALGGTPLGAWEVTYTAYDQAQPPATRTEQRFNRKRGAQASACAGAGSEASAAVATALLARCALL